jgi:hypothetical protein
MSFDEARSLLEEAEQLARADDPMAAMDFMQRRRFKRIPKELIGPAASPGRRSGGRGHHPRETHRAGRSKRIARVLEVPGRFAVPLDFPFSGRRFRSLGRR